MDWDRSIEWCCWYWLRYSGAYVSSPSNFNVHAFIFNASGLAIELKRFPWVGASPLICWRTCAYGFMIDASTSASAWSSMSPDIFAVTGRTRFSLERRKNDFDCNWTDGRCEWRLTIFRVWYGRQFHCPVMLRSAQLWLCSSCQLSLAPIGCAHTFCKIVFCIRFSMPKMESTGRSCRTVKNCYEFLNETKPLSHQYAGFIWTLFRTKTYHLQRWLDDVYDRILIHQQPGTRAKVWSNYLGISA